MEGVPNLLLQSKDVKEVIEDLRTNLESYFTSKSSPITLLYIKSLLVEFRKKHRNLSESTVEMKDLTGKAMSNYEDAQVRLWNLQYRKQHYESQITRCSEYAPSHVDHLSQIDIKAEREDVIAQLNAELEARKKSKERLEALQKQFAQIEEDKAAITTKLAKIPKIMSEINTLKLKEFIDYRGVLPEELLRLYKCFKDNSFDPSVKRCIKVIIDFEGIKIVFEAQDDDLVYAGVEGMFTLEKVLGSLVPELWPGEETYKNDMVRCPWFDVLGNDAQGTEKVLEALSHRVNTLKDESN